MSSNGRHETSQPATDPQEIQSLTQSILDNWQRLPADEAAVVTASLIQTLSEAHSGEPLNQDELFTIPFEDQAITRGQVGQVLGEAAAASFSQSEMGKLATGLAVAYEDEHFWRDLWWVSHWILSDRK